jgi:leader peptidase (prepilin peptidase)/N-methyltransferase
MVPAAVIDVERRRIPDVWVVASLSALVAVLSVETVADAATRSGATLAGIISGAVAMALPLLALHVVSPDAMGFGDVKAAVALGAAIGTIDWRLGTVALCLAALTGATAGVLGRRCTIAFGPYLVFGAWTVVLAGEPIVDALFTGASPR